jgi:glutathione S-transferase
VAATLYAVPASHPCACVEHALRLKAIRYRRVDLLPVLHKPLQRARFGRGTVPGLVLDGVRVLGSRPILRLLEARVPEPALLPAAEEERAAVQLAETWGDEVLQPLIRRLMWASLSRDPSALPTYSRGSRLAVTAPLARLGAPLLARAESLINRASDSALRDDLVHLDRHARRVERGSRRGHWAESGPTPPTCRSAPGCGWRSPSATSPRGSTVAPPASWPAAGSPTTPATCRPAPCRQRGSRRGGRE